MPLKRDSMGFIMDRTGDGGDSANRAGILALCGSHEDLKSYIQHDDQAVRHPTQAPWNNPLNFTRDQLIPLIAGLWRQKRYDLVRRLFWEHAKRGFFTQSIERDKVGSRKKLYPHQFYKDSRPDATTLPMKFNWKKFKFETTLVSNEPNVEIEHKYSDYRDILLPGDIWTMIYAGKIFWLYPFVLVGLPMFVLSLYTHCKKYQGNDEGQIIAAAAVQGDWALRLYKKWRPDWRERLKQYWIIDREQGEIALMLNAVVGDS